MQTLCIYNHKGGVGKTSTAVHLAVFAAQNGIKTLLIDADSQGSASRALGLSNTDGSLCRFLRGTGIDIYSTHTTLLSVMTASIELAVFASQEQQSAYDELMNNLIQRGYELCIIDCAPSFNQMQVNILRVSNYFVVPIEPQYLALEGLISLFKTINRIKYVSFESFARPLGIVFTKVHRTKLSQDIQNVIRSEYGELVIEPPIPWSAKVDRAAYQSVDLFTLYPRATVTYAYRQLAKNVLQRLSLLPISV